MAVAEQSDRLLSLVIIIKRLVFPFISHLPIHLHMLCYFFFFGALSVLASIESLRYRFLPDPHRIVD